MSLNLGTLFIFIVGFALAFVPLAFWIWMLVDCIKNETDEGSKRIFWGIVIATTHVIGSAIYFFARKLGRARLAI